MTRVKTMFLRAQRTEGAEVQTALVASTIPSQGGKSVRMAIGKWMPHALRALPRPDLLHCQHPMVVQRWQHIPGEGPESFKEKVRMLVEFLHNVVGITPRPKKKTHLVREKTMVFCNESSTAAELAELLATTHNFSKVGIMVKKVSNDERRKRMRMFRDGEIMLLVCTDILSRGIDVPDVECVVQFDFPQNVVGHIHRIGRASRAGSRGRTLNFYDDSERGGRALAEAVQEVGSAPLDGLFSRNKGFKKTLARTAAFRDMLEMQGLPLPLHLQEAPEADSPNLLAESLLRDVEEDSEDEALDLSYENGDDPLEDGSKVRKH